MPIIWIVEDNAAFRRATVRAFRGQPNIERICAFERCEEALEALKRGERPHVIFMDIGLPGIDGIEGIQRVKVIAPEVDIVLLTVFEDDDRIFRATCAGASGYLLKSEPMQQVMEAIEQVQAGGAPMNPRIARRVMEMFSKMTGSGKDYGINPREKAVLELMVNGLARKQIADQMRMNLHTVDYVTRCIYHKLHVNCVAAAVSVAMKEHLVRFKPPGDN